MCFRNTWKAYVLVFAIYRIHELGANANTYPTLVQHLYLVLGLVGTVPIVGFVFHQRIFRRVFWRAWFFFTIVWGVFDLLVYTPGFHLSSAPQVSPVIVWLLSLIIVLPTYLAMYSYSFRSPTLWVGSAQAAPHSPAV